MRQQSYKFTKKHLNEFATAKLVSVFSPPANKMISEELE